jgi:hypothetical protein
MDLEPEPHPTVVNQPRTRRIPPRYDIFTLNTNEPLTQLQRPPSPLPPQVSSPLPSPQPSTACSTRFETSPDKWGLFRRYREVPSRFCDETNHKDVSCDALTFANVQAGMAERDNNLNVLISEGDASPTTEPTNSEASQSLLGRLYVPFKNATRWLLIKWWYSRSKTTSLKDLDTLVKDVILDPRFKAGDLQNFSASKELKLLDLPINSEDGWRESSVELPLPCSGVKYRSESHAPTVTIKGIWHRNILTLIKQVYEGSQFFDLHLRGFIQMWKRSDDEPATRVHCEAYSSDVYLELEEEVRATLPPSDTEDPIENVAVMLQVYSDSTQLANFGHASLWPIYAFLVSLSKYIRMKPSVASAMHWAYIPSVCYCNSTSSFAQLVL